MYTSWTSLIEINKMCIYQVENASKWFVFMPQMISFIWKSSEHKMMVAVKAVCHMGEILAIMQHHATPLIHVQ